MFKALRAMVGTDAWSVSSLHQKLSVYAVLFGAFVMLDAIAFVMIVKVSGASFLIGAFLSLWFLVILLSTVLDWFWGWSEELSQPEVNTGGKGIEQRDGMHSA